jgi:hypothetical protein
MQNAIALYLLGIDGSNAYVVGKVVELILSKVPGAYYVGSPAG